MKDDDAFVKAVASRLEFIRQLKVRLEWQELPPEKKQASRLEWIASHKRRGAMVEKKEALFKLYSTIQSSLPHILFLNHTGLLEDFVQLCQNICEAIDFRGRTYDQLTSEDIPFFYETLKEVPLLNHPLFQDSVKIAIATKDQIEEVFKLLD